MKNLKQITENLWLEKDKKEMFQNVDVITFNTKQKLSKEFLESVDGLIQDIEMNPKLLEFNEDIVKSEM